MNTELRRVAVFTTLAAALGLCMLGCAVNSEQSTGQSGAVSTPGTMKADTAATPTTTAGDTSGIKR